MERIIVVNGFKIRKSSKKDGYSVNVFGQGNFSMLSNNGSIKQDNINIIGVG